MRSKLDLGEVAFCGDAPRPVSMAVNPKGAVGMGVQGCKIAVTSASPERALNRHGVFKDAAAGRVGGHIDPSA